MIALITGITGQDGSYLAEFLLEKGYEVHGIERRSSFTESRVNTVIDPIYRHHKKLHMHYGDVTDSASLSDVINKINPNEIYNLAAQSHVGLSFKIPVYTSEVDGMGVLRILEAIRLSGKIKTCKLYQASTSELFGKVREVPQTENTAFYPRSPYGVSKLMGYWSIVNYREIYGMYACNGIMFNHESPRRGENFVTRKITIGVSNVKRGKQDCLYLGNLNATRDWGHARDYVECMWKILQKDEPEDYVIATGETTSVRDFVRIAFKCVDIDLKFEGEGLEEVGIDAKTGKIIVRVDPEFFRPTEVDKLLGDPSKAVKKLNWNPRSTSLEKMIEEMVNEDLKRLDMS
jgi:GDPmannose 4,6-dehydratase